MKPFRQHKGKSVKWINYNKDGILIAPIIWKCAWKNFVKIFCSSWIFMHVKFYMHHMKTCKKMWNFYASSTRVNDAYLSWKIFKKTWREIWSSETSTAMFVWKRFKKIVFVVNSAPHFYFNVQRSISFFSFFFPKWISLLGWISSITHVFCILSQQL